MTVVEIVKPGKYNRGLGIKKFGILVEKKEETALVDFSGNGLAGNCANVEHGDYRVVSAMDWVIIDHEVVVLCSDGRNYYTGLKVR